jgi:hypothetical protein
MKKKRLEYYDEDQPSDDVVDGEVLAEYSGTRLNLPQVNDDDATPEPYTFEVDTGRRGFITRVLIGGAAALALGGGAAILVEEQRRAREPQVIVLPNGAEVNQTDVSELYARIADLEGRLAAVMAERDQMISDLSFAEANQTDIAARLADAEAELDQYRSLIDLWQRLDAVGLDDLVQTAFSVVGTALAALLTVNEMLNTGLAVGQRAITGFVSSLPGPRDGVRWLERQVTTLGQNLDWLAVQVQEAVDPVEPFAQLIANFVVWVLSRLPFGIGSRAEAGMEAMKTIINDLPNLAEGINRDVLDPLVDWFGTDDTATLDGILLNPVDENIVKPAREVLAKVVALEQAYQDNFVTPVQSALDDRASLRDQIHSAQAKLGLMA